MIYCSVAHPETFAGLLGGSGIEMLVSVLLKSLSADI